MTDQEFVLSIIAIVMGCTVLMVGISKITGLVKSWINRDKDSLNEEAFDRLARAFMQHKKDMQERVQHLEAIIAGEKQKNTGSFLEIEEPQSEDRLTNDLQQKDSVKS